MFIAYNAYTVLTLTSLFCTVQGLSCFAHLVRQILNDITSKDGLRKASIYNLSESEAYIDPEEYKLSVMNTFLGLRHVMPVLILFKLM